MLFKNVALESIEYVLPEEIWTSEAIEVRLNDLYHRLDLPLGRLEMMTGIKERRHWNAHTLPSEASTLAGKRLMKRTAVPVDQIDMLIHASVCRDRLEPATAAYVHRNLSLPSHTQILDVSNACLGVLNAMVLASGLIENGLARAVMVVSGENGRHLLDWTIEQLNRDRLLTRKTIKPYFANLTIGSGAVALLLCHVSLIREPKPLFLGGCGLTDSKACSLCEGQGTGNGSLAMQTDAEALLNAGIKLSQTAWEKCKKTLSWENSTPQIIVTHQVGKKHRQMLYEALNLNMTKDFSTFEYLGNTGSVALPLSLAKAVESQSIKTGDRVLLLGIGSGLSTLMLGLQFQ